MGTVLGPRGEVRMAPALPVTSMVSFELHQPIQTHFKIVSCEAIDCEAWRGGWKTGFDLTDPEQVALANWVRGKSGLRHTYEQVDTKVIFTFEPGQRCFESYRTPHRVSLERDPIAIRRPGDWRGSPDGRRVRHVRLDDWVDDFATHQDKINDQVQQG